MSRDPLDRYMTPDHVAGAVARWMRVPPDWTIVEPSVGHGAWLAGLRSAGHRGHTIACDVWPEARGLAMADEAHVADFLALDPRPADLVIGNPPFRLAADFVRAGLRWAPHVAMLLRGTFAEVTQSRSDFWRQERCVLEWHIGERLRFAGPDGEEPRGTDSVCHSVFFFAARGRVSWVPPQWGRVLVRPSDPSWPPPLGPLWGQA